MALGQALGEAGFAVCSGGYGGVMEAVSRGARSAGARTYGVTAEFFKPQVNRWIDTEVRMKTWQERLFELVRLAHGFVACKGGTGTLVELAVVWEMLNKSVIAGKTNGGAGRFLDAHSGARARSGVGTCNRVGRSERQIGAYSGNTADATGFLQRALMR